MMKTKRICGVLLALVLLALCPVTAQASYSDSWQAEWAESAIDRWSEYGVVEGDRDSGAFRPLDTMKRSEAAKVFSTLLKLDGAADLSGFYDLDPTAWYMEYLGKVVAAGIMEGDGAGRLNPNGAVTREQMATMLSRALAIPEADTMSAASSYSDVGQISSWAKGYMNALVNRGYLRGTSAPSGWIQGTLSPGDPINRASVMSLLDQTISTYGNAGGQSLISRGGGITLVAADNITVSGVADDLVILGGAKNGTITLQSAKVRGTLTVDTPVTLSLNGAATVGAIDLTEDAVETSVLLGPDAQASTINTDAKSSLIYVDGAVDSLTASESALGSLLSVNRGGSVGAVMSDARNSQMEISGTATTAAVSDKAGGSTLTVSRTGSADNVSMAASGSTVNVNGNAGQVRVAESARHADINVGGGANIDSLTTAAPYSNIDVGGNIKRVTISPTADWTDTTAANDAVIGPISLQSDDSTVNTRGASVSRVVVEGSRDTVTTTGEVQVASDASGTRVNDVSVSGGTIVPATDTSGQHGGNGGNVVTTAVAVNSLTMTYTRANGVRITSVTTEPSSAAANISNGNGISATLVNSDTGTYTVTLQSPLTVTNTSIYNLRFGNTITGTLNGQAVAISRGSSGMTANFSYLPDPILNVKCTGLTLNFANNRFTISASTLTSATNSNSNHGLTRADLTTTTNVSAPSTTGNVTTTNYTVTVALNSSKTETHQLDFGDLLVAGVKLEGMDTGTVVSVTPSSDKKTASILIQDKQTKDATAVTYIRTVDLTLKENASLTPKDSAFTTQVEASTTSGTKVEGVTLSGNSRSGYTLTVPSTGSYQFSGTNLTLTIGGQSSGLSVQTSSAGTTAAFAYHPAVQVGGVRVSYNASAAEESRFTVAGLTDTDGNAINDPTQEISVAYSNPNGYITGTVAAATTAGNSYDFSQATITAAQGSVSNVANKASNMTFNYTPAVAGAKYVTALTLTYNRTYNSSNSFTISEAKAGTESIASDKFTINATLNPSNNGVQLYAVTLSSADTATPLAFNNLTASGITVGEESGTVTNVESNGETATISFRLPNQEITVSAINALYQDGSLNVTAVSTLPENSGVYSDAVKLVNNGGKSWSLSDGSDQDGYDVKFADNGVTVAITDSIATKQSSLTVEQKEGNFSFIYPYIQSVEITYMPSVSDLSARYNVSAVVYANSERATSSLDSVATLNPPSETAEEGAYRLQIKPTGADTFTKLEKVTVSISGVTDSTRDRIYTKTSEPSFTQLGSGTIEIQYAEPYAITFEDGASKEVRYTDTDGKISGIPEKADTDTKTFAGWYLAPSGTDTEGTYQTKTELEKNPYTAAATYTATWVDHTQTYAVSVKNTYAGKNIVSSALTTTVYADASVEVVMSDDKETFNPASIGVQIQGATTTLSNVTLITGITQPTASGSSETGDNENTTKTFSELLTNLTHTADEVSADTGNKITNDITVKIGDSEKASFTFVVTKTTKGFTVKPKNYTDIMAIKAAWDNEQITLLTSTGTNLVFKKDSHLKMQDGTYLKTTSDLTLGNNTNISTAFTGVSNSADDDSIEKIDDTITLSLAAGSVGFSSGITTTIESSSIDGKTSLPDLVSNLIATNSGILAKLEGALQAINDVAEILSSDTDVTITFAAPTTNSSE